LQHLNNFFNILNTSFAQPAEQTVGANPTAFEFEALQ
jgi:hypothetical protein